VITKRLSHFMTVLLSVSKLRCWPGQLLTRWAGCAQKNAKGRLETNGCILSQIGKAE
jgi:hypothetical protein